MIVVSQNNPTERINTNEQAGRVRVAYATYEASAEQATIEMFNLPNDTTIIAHNFQIIII